RDGLVVGSAELVQLVGVNDHILPLGVFVGRDDGLLGYLAVDGTGLVVLDAAVAIGMELVEMDAAAAGSGDRVGLDRDRNQGELQEPFPTGTCSHGWTSSCGHVPAVPLSGD